jgi:hypothetical protein
MDGRLSGSSVSTVNDDQYDAARREARKLMQRVLPGIENVPVSGEPHPWVARIFDRFLTPFTARCRHIDARPVQPVFLNVSEGVWRCRRCVGDHALELTAALAAGWSLGPIEEFTCDMCRRYVGRELVPLTIRQDFWVIDLAICQRCQDFAANNGAHLYVPNDGHTKEKK